MKIHIVQKDETLWKIAQKYGVALDDVIAANPQISNPDLIMPGMKIKVPTVSDAKQQPAPTDKKQQVQPGTGDKKDKQEVKPEVPNQIMPVIEEDDDKKWEPLKKEMPSLPIHFNKQPQQPVQPAPSPSQDLKWTQLTNNFETHIHPTKMPKEDDYVAGVEEPPKLEKGPVHPPYHPPHPLPKPMPQAPCYSKEGIPYGGGQMNYMPHYPIQEGSKPQHKSQKHVQPHSGWYQAQMPPMNDCQSQPMPYGPSYMPQNQELSYQQQPMSYPQQPFQQMMPQQSTMPASMYGEPMIPQPGAPNYPMMPMPYDMQGPQQMPYPSYPQHPAPYGQKKKNDCGCGGSR